MKNKLCFLLISLCFVLTLASAFIVGGCGEKSYTVKFNTNGGATIKEMELSSGKVKLPYASIGDNILMYGYYFDGWFYDSALTKKVDANAFEINGDITLYAKWSNEYSIYFDTTTNEVLPEKKFACYSTVSLSDLPTPKPLIINGTAYEFKRWVRMDNNTAITGDFKMVAQDMFMQAEFYTGVNGNFTINLNGNYESINSQSVTTVEGLSMGHGVYSADVTIFPSMQDGAGLVFGANVPDGAQWVNSSASYYCFYILPNVGGGAVQISIVGERAPYNSMTAGYTMDAGKFVGTKFYDKMTAFKSSGSPETFNLKVLYTADKIVGYVDGEKLIQIDISQNTTESRVKEYYQRLYGTGVGIRTSVIGVEFSNLKVENDARATIYYDANGGKYPTDYEKKALYKEFGNIGVPTRHGFDFKGWYYELGGEEKLLTEDTVIDENTLLVNLKAKWQLRDDSVSIQFAYVTNSSQVLLPDTYIVGDADYKLKTPSPVYYSQKYCQFEGWYSDEELTEKFEISSLDGTTQDTQVTVYAKYSYSGVFSGFRNNNNVYTSIESTSLTNFDGKTLSEGVLSADVTLDKKAEAGIIFKAKVGDSDAWTGKGFEYYCFYLMPSTAGGAVQVARVNHGAWVSLTSGYTMDAGKFTGTNFATKYANFVANGGTETFNLKVVFNDKFILGYIDGELIVSLQAGEKGFVDVQGQSAKLYSNSYGLRTNVAGTVFKNVTASGYDKYYAYYDKEMVVLNALTYSALPTPTKYGYIFDGWYLNGEKVTTSTNFANKGVYEFVSKWSLDPTIPKVNFNFVTNTQESMDEFVFVIGSGDVLPMPSALPNGKIFLGWYYEEDLTTLVDLTKLTEDGEFTVYAKYGDSVVGDKFTTGLNANGTIYYTNITSGVIGSLGGQSVSVPYEFSADITLANNQEAGIIFSADLSGYESDVKSGVEYYAFSILRKSTAGGALQVARVSGGEYVSFTSGFTVDAGKFNDTSSAFNVKFKNFMSASNGTTQTFNFKVRVYEDKIQVFMDNELITTITKETDGYKDVNGNYVDISGKGVGFRAVDAKIKYTNIVVNSIEEQE